MHRLFVFIYGVMDGEVRDYKVFFRAPILVFALMIEYTHQEEKVSIFFLKESLGSKKTFPTIPPFFRVSPRRMANWSKVWVHFEAAIRVLSTVNTYLRKIYSLEFRNLLYNNCRRL